MVKNLLLSLLAVFCLMTASAQTQTVKGLVIDETGTPIVGATVVVKDRPTIGTSTSVKGEFELSGVPQTGKLQISYVGYKTQDVDVAANIRVQLEPDAQNVEAVVVTGMTQMDKRLFTGAADQLVADDVKLAGMADISRGLEGRSAGVSVQNVSGTFGTAPKSVSAEPRRSTAAPSRCGSWTVSSWRISSISMPMPSRRVTPRR